jgi:hypothetical protein
MTTASKDLPNKRSILKSSAVATVSIRGRLFIVEQIDVKFAERRVQH